MFSGNSMQFYPKNLHLVANFGIFCFCEIMYLRKQNAHFKNVSHGKSSYFDTHFQLQFFFFFFFDEIIEYLCKKKEGVISKYEP